MAGFTPQVFDHLFDGLKASEITPALLVDRARARGAEITLEDLKGAIDAHRLRGVAISLQDWRLLGAKAFRK